MKYVLQIAFVIAAGASMGCSGGTARQPPAASSPTDGGKPHDHAASTEKEAGALGDATARSSASEELAAYEKARPIFAAYCGGCHTSKGATTKPEALEHFSMDSYPFGGHHASEITGTVRAVLGATGSKPTMPADKPGAVKGDELQLILSWADAVDRAHAAASKGGHTEHEHGGHDHEQAGHDHEQGPKEHEPGGHEHGSHGHGGTQKAHQHGSGGHKH